MGSIRWPELGIRPPKPPHHRGSTGDGFGDGNRFDGRKWIHIRQRLLGDATSTRDVVFYPSTVDIGHTLYASVFFTRSSATIFPLYPTTGVAISAPASFGWW